MSPRAGSWTTRPSPSSIDIHASQSKLNPEIDREQHDLVPSPLILTDRHRDQYAQN